MKKRRFKRTKSTLRNPAVWSNLLFVIPAGISIYYGNFFLVVPALLILISSILYHLSYNRVVEHVDEIFAGLYFLVGAYLLWKVDFPSPTTEIVVLIMGVGLVAFLYSHRVLSTKGWKKYREIHKWWHISSASSAVIIYLAYFGVLPI